ncbi:MAG: DoxX family protein [Thermocrispum sp.]
MGRRVNLSSLNRGASAVPVIARVAVGAMMFVHGLDKLTGGVDGFAGGLAGMGVPGAPFFAWVVTLLELVGGLMLVAGLLSRLIAAAMTIELIFAIILVTGAKGLIAGQGEGVGFERDVAYIVCFLVVVLLGPGRPSLDHLLRVERSVAAPGRV